MSVMDTVSEPAQTEREKHIRSVDVRQRTQCRERVCFVCFSKRDSASNRQHFRAEREKKKQRQRQFAHHAAAQVTFLTAFFQQSQC